MTKYCACREKWHRNSSCGHKRPKIAVTSDQKLRSQATQVCTFGRWYGWCFRNSGEPVSCYGSLSHYLQGFFQHLRWLFGISSINSMSVSSLKEVNLPSVILGNKKMVVMHDAGFSKFSNPHTHSHFGAIEGEHPWQTWLLVQNLVSMKPQIWSILSGKKLCWAMAMWGRGM